MPNREPVEFLSARHINQGVTAYTVALFSFNAGKRMMNILERCYTFTEIFT